MPWGLIWIPIFPALMMPIFRKLPGTIMYLVALLLAICKTESDFDPNVVSGAGAVGLMQLMPETAASLGVSNPYDPYQNIMGGAKFISQLVEQLKAIPMA